MDKSTIQSGKYFEMIFDRVCMVFIYFSSLRGSPSACFCYERLDRRYERLSKHYDQSKVVYERLKHSIEHSIRNYERLS